MPHWDDPAHWTFRNHEAREQFLELAHRHSWLEPTHDHHYDHGEQGVLFFSMNSGLVQLYWRKEGERALYLEMKQGSPDAESQVWGAMDQLGMNYYG